MVVTVFLVKAGLPAEMPVWIKLAVEVLVGAVTYGLTLITLFKERLLTFWRLVVPTKTENAYSWVPPATLAVVPESLRRESASQPTSQG